MTPPSCARRSLFGIVLLSALVACASPEARRARPPATAAPTSVKHGTVTQAGAVGTYVSTPWGFSTSSYWIDGPQGLIAIDTQFLPSAAEEMIAMAEAATKKHFVLAIVLHPNPDKFNGTATFQKHGVRVVTSAQVKAQIPAVHAQRTEAFYDRYAPDYPRELPQPDTFGDQTTELEAAGVKLRLHVMKAGCSENHVVVEYAKQVFVGDLVANKAHSWLEIGKTDQWLERMAELRRLSPTRVHPGRGASGGATLLDDEEAYLKKVITLVAEEKPSMPVRDDALDRVEAKLTAAYPDYAFPVFLKIGLPAEWERQATAPKSR